MELCYLALNSEYKPVIDRKIIPFVYEADAKSAMPELIAEGTVLVKGVNLKVFVDESKNKSTVSVIMKMGLTASVIENQLITYIDDAFSKDFLLTLDKKTIKTSKSTIPASTIDGTGPNINPTIGHKINNKDISLSNTFSGKYELSPPITTPTAIKILIKAIDLTFLKWLILSSQYSFLKKTIKKDLHLRDPLHYNSGCIRKPPL